MHWKHVVLLKYYQLVISERSIFGLERSDWWPQRPNARASEYSSYHYKVSSITYDDNMVKRAISHTDRMVRYPV